MSGPIPLLFRLILALVFVMYPAYTASISYLQQVSDRYQKTVDVYTVADAAGNHFAARGEFDNLSSALVPAMDEISPNAPCPGITCITATFDPGRTLWGGWYFMNGILGATDRQPVPNWGFTPNAGYDLSGATALRFRVRGKSGGEKILFFCCGVGYNPDTGQTTAPYPDSSRRVSLAVQATTDWVQHSIDLTGVNLSYVLGGFGWVAARDGALANPNPITFYLADIQYDKPRPNDPRLLVSYETVKSSNAFDAVLRNTAYVYDNAAAMIALIATGDLARAHTIADALIYAQQHDRFFSGTHYDGRLRNAYQGGDVVLPPGWLPNNQPNTARMPGWYDAGHTAWFEDATQVSTNTGNIAWAGMALLNLYETTQEAKYLNAAKALGQWVIQNASGNPTRGQGGFTGGFDGWESAAVSGSAGSCASGVVVNGQCKRLYKSTEHNIDLYSLFSRLYIADPAGAAKWASAAQNAKHFFLSMWDPQEGKFWTGTTEDGVTIAKDVIPVDIQAWSILSLGSEAQPYRDAALAYVEAHHKTSLGYGFKQNGGNSCGDNTWFEGTSQVAVAHQQSGNTAKWQSILDTIHGVQLQTGAMLATDGACLNTGFTLNDGSPWLYYPRAHVGATAWLSLAENGVNPYRGNLYSPSLSSSSVTFPDQAVGVTSAAQAVTLLNPGPSPLSIQSVAVTGANASDFAQTNSCGGVVQAGAQCTVSVTFTPTAQNLRQATLTITEQSDSAVQPVAFAVALAGKGVGGPSQSFNLTLQVSPGAAGTIAATPSSVTGAYPSGTRVCLSASASSGWVFQGWAGAALDFTGCLVMDSDKSVTANFVAVGATPSIQVTSLSQFGSLPGSVAGIVSGVTPSNYQIVPLVFLTGQGWYSKPYCNAATVALGQDGSFSIVFTTGGVDQFAKKIALILVPVSFTVPCYTSAAGIPSDLLQHAAAQVVINRPNPNEREIQFSGQPWAVKASTVPIGPGGCIFSDSSDNVAVDSQGRLHLKITNSGGTWSCAEIFSRVAVGYGVYRWTIGGVPTLDPTSVFGSFTWADAESAARELDVEVGFTKPGDSTNAQFVIQPATQAGNLQRISLPTSGPVTFKMTWMPDGVSFQAFLGTDETGNKLADWKYAGGVPPADRAYENFRFNLWLNGGPPASGQTQEVVISNYQYQPFVVDTTAPSLDGLLNGASFVSSSSPGGIFTVFGRNLAKQPQSAAAVPLPTSLGDVVVYINGISTPLFYVSPNQINGQVPYAAQVGSSQVALLTHGRSSQVIAFGNTAAAPGIFTSASQNCLVQNQDHSLNAPNNPAAVGSEVTAYLTGIGKVDNPVPSGAVAPSSPLSRPVLAGTAQIGGQSVNMDFLGLVPGLVGVGQANIRIPLNTLAGLQSLLITIGGAVSNSCSMAIGSSSSSMPSVSSVNPFSGPLAGGTSVTISGANFASGATVKFGSAAATGVSVISASVIHATTPAAASAGIVEVTVTNSDGQSGVLPNAFTYRIIPTLSSIQPTQGSRNGGTAITLTGTGFTTGATVNIGGVAATQVNVTTSTTITAVTGSINGGGLFDVTVINPDGQSTTLPHAFTYTQPPPPPPTVVSVTPSSGSTSGGTPVSIAGTNFTSGASVRFGTVNATISQVYSQQILATTPPGVGTVSVTVTNSDGQSGVLPNAFTYQNPGTNNPTIQATTQACTVKGTVSGISSTSAFRVVVYALTNQYYVQACDFDPPAPIGTDGRWGPIESHNGTIYALLVRQGYVPAVTLQSLPQPDGINVFAISSSAGALSGCDVARCPAR